MRTENFSLTKITNQKELKQISPNFKLGHKLEKSEKVNRTTLEHLYTEALSGLDISTPNKNILKEYLFKNKGFNCEDCRILMEIRHNLDIYRKYYNDRDETLMDKQNRERLLRN